MLPQYCTTHCRGGICNHNDNIVGKYQCFHNFFNHLCGSSLLISLHANQPLPYLFLLLRCLRLFGYLGAVGAMNGNQRAVVQGQPHSPPILPHQSYLCLPLARLWNPLLSLDLPPTSYKNIINTITAVTGCLSAILNSPRHTSTLHLSAMRTIPAHFSLN